MKYEVQGGVKNYLGKQKEVMAPLKWKSSPNHPETELAERKSDVRGKRRKVRG